MLLEIYDLIAMTGVQLLVVTGCSEGIDEEGDVETLPSRTRDG